jgi:peptide/nickel transport system ATP-binding protein/oligopeptide transport system ATP-binding protein
VRKERARRLTVIEGQPPILSQAPDACTFRDRCPVGFEVCTRMNPQLFPVGAGHGVACFRADPGIAPSAVPSAAAETAHA